jgi:CBS domain-containing protein
VSLLDTPVRAVMTEPMRTVDPDLPVREVAAYLTDIGSVVVDADPPGIVTKTDVVAAVRDGRDLAETTVASLLSRPVVSADVDADLREAVDLMESEGLRRLPIRADGRFVGIVTTTDLLSALAADSRTVAGVLARAYDPTGPHAYECVDCGARITADHRPGACPECGGRTRNIGVSRE